MAVKLCYSPADCVSKLCQLVARVGLDYEIEMFYWRLVANKESYSVGSIIWV